MIGNKTVKVPGKASVASPTQDAIIEIHNGQKLDIYRSRDDAICHLERREGVHPGAHGTRGSWLWLACPASFAQSAARDMILQSLPPFSRLVIAKESRRARVTKKPVIFSAGRGPRAWIPDISSQGGAPTGQSRRRDNGRSIVPAIPENRRNLSAAPSLFENSTEGRKPVEQRAGSF